MQLEFGYGKGVQTVELPQESLLGVLHAAPIEHERRGPDAVSWALDAAFRKYGPSATVLAMPHGGSTLPYLQDAGPDHSRT